MFWNEFTNDRKHKWTEYRYNAFVLINDICVIKVWEYNDCNKNEYGVSFKIS
jgi:hypothetical protein